MAADAKIQSKTFVSGSKSHGHGPFHMFKFLLYLWLQTRNLLSRPLRGSLTYLIGLPKMSIFKTWNSHISPLASKEYTSSFRLN